MTRPSKNSRTQGSSRHRSSSRAAGLRNLGPILANMTHLEARGRNREDLPTPKITMEILRAKMTFINIIPALERRMHIIFGKKLGENILKMQISIAVVTFTKLVQTPARIKRSKTIEQTLLGIPKKRPNGVVATPKRKKTSTKSILTVTCLDSKTANTPKRAGRGTPPPTLMIPNSSTPIQYSTSLSSAKK